MLLCTIMYSRNVKFILMLKNFMQRPVQKGLFVTLNFVLCVLFSHIGKKASGLEHILNYTIHH